MRVILVGPQEFGVALYSTTVKNADPSLSLVGHPCNSTYADSWCNT